MATKTKTHRLNQYHREALSTLAFKKVGNLETYTAGIAATKAALDVAIAAEVVKAFPSADMAILKKYNCAASDNCVYVSAGNGNYGRYIFAEDFAAPVRPNTNGCHRTPILLEGEVGETYATYLSTVVKARAAWDATKKSYISLITTAKTFEEVLAVWPEAEELRERITGSANAITITLAPETVAAIKADMEARAARLQ